MVLPCRCSSGTAPVQRQYSAGTAEAVLLVAAAQLQTKRRRWQWWMQQKKGFAQVLTLTQRLTT